MKKKSIAGNYIYNLVYQVVLIFLPIVTTPYLSRVLGAEKVGVYSYTVSIVTYFILLATLGTSLYGQREVAYVQDDIQKRTKVFYEILILRLITTAISSLMFFCTFVLFGEYQVYFAILLVDLIATAFDITWFFQGVENFRTIAVRNLIIKIAGAASMFIFVNSADDLWIYILIYALSVLVSNISLWPYLPKYLAKKTAGKINVKRHLKPVFGLFIPQITTQIYTVLDKVMIGAIISGKSELGCYEQSEKIIKLLITIITSLTTVMIPRVAQALTKKDDQLVSEYIGKSMRFVFLVAFPMIFGIVAIADTFSPIFFGDGYDKVPLVMIVLSPIILMISLGSVVGVQYLVPAKRQRELTMSYVIGAAANVILNVALIGKLGALGAAIGTVFAETLVTITQLVFVRRNFKLVEFFSQMRNYVIAGVAMLAACLGVKMLLSDGVGSLIAVVVSGIIAYAVLLVVMRDELLMDIWKKIGDKWQVRKE